jgi:hypothetical protein
VWWCNATTGTGTPAQTFSCSRDEGFSSTACRGGGRSGGGDGRYDCGNGALNPSHIRVVQKGTLFLLAEEHKERQHKARSLAVTNRLQLLAKRIKGFVARGRFLVSF